MKVCYSIPAPIKFATIYKYFKFTALLLGMKIVIEINNVYVFLPREPLKLPIVSQKLEKSY